MQRSRIGVPICVLTALATCAPAAAVAPESQPEGWALSAASWGANKDQQIGLKIDDHRVMWLGGTGAPDPADSSRTAIYDTRSQQFTERARIPAVKSITDPAHPGLQALVTITAGVLGDGTVVIAGGDVSRQDERRNRTSKLSYRYDPRTNVWTRTGDLPEPQAWIGTPSLLLPDGRLLQVGGGGVDWAKTGVASTSAFVYDPRKQSTVDELDPTTGDPTGRRITVRGAWDYTRTRDGRVSRLREGHLFGNAVALHDGRVLVTAGHIKWDIGELSDGDSLLATSTEFFDWRTGAWTQGPALPVVPAEDAKVTNSHGGRANGTCVTQLTSGKVVIAGGGDFPDGPYDGTGRDRQSILILTVASDARRSRIAISPAVIPSGRGSGSYFGDDGRNQLLCYALPNGQVWIAGGQDNIGEDLFDTYYFDADRQVIDRGPDLVHGVPTFNEAWGYPPDYEAPAITTREVGMHDSLLVFPGGVYVAGGGYDAYATAYVGSRRVEQFGKAYRH